MVGLEPDRDWSGSIPSMQGADFSGADLTGAIFWRVDLAGASFCDAIPDGAEFEQASLERTQMVATSVPGTIFRKVSVYGIAAWYVRSDDKTIFEDVMVRGPRSGPIEVDHPEIAQFIYMLVHSPTIRRVLDAVTAKAVLILGRSNPCRSWIAFGTLSDRGAMYLSCLILTGPPVETSLKRSQPSHIYPGS